MIVRRLDQAVEDLEVAADCLIAFRRGDPESVDAAVGAILEARAFHALKLIAERGGL